MLQASSASSRGPYLFWSHQANQKPHRQLHPVGLAELGGWTGWISTGVSKELHPPAMPGSRHAARSVFHFTTNLAGLWHWSHVLQ